MTHLDLVMHFKTNKKSFFSSIGAEIDILYNQKITLQIIKCYLIFN